jgi:hypothetical protein
VGHSFQQKSEVQTTIYREWLRNERLVLRGVRKTRKETLTEGVVEKECP